VDPDQLSGDPNPVSSKCATAEPARAVRTMSSAGAAARAIFPAIAASAPGEGAQPNRSARVQHRLYVIASRDHVWNAKPGTAFRHLGTLLRDKRVRSLSAANLITPTHRIGYLSALSELGLLTHPVRVVQVACTSQVRSAKVSRRRLRTVIERAGTIHLGAEQTGTSWRSGLERAVFETFSDRTFVITTSASFVLLVLSTVLSIFHTVMKTVTLDVRQWLICIAAALSIVVAAEIRKTMLWRTSVHAPSWPCAHTLNPKPENVNSNE
jgi:hypothetical protein